ncbi:MAG: outer membrane beta-barrel protein [Bacteroidaceae bacterium]|nr:outer membrane beta-barrel protein [Bacteroidaceae bacterium]
MSHFTKTFSVLCLAFLFITTATAQTIITGTVQDETTKEPVASAIAAVIGDSGIVSNVNTNEEGRFMLSLKRAGKYRLRVSFIGYGTINETFEAKADGDTVNFGLLPMISGQQLGEAVVTATAARVAQVEDTTIYNAAAYRVPTGATLEALVKQFPGIQVSDDGTITWNGKTVSEFLVNGKDFFKGDTETAMKNLPADLVSQIKAYDRRSDYAEQTGIDDGNETTVLDIQTKKELNESWITNNDLAVGTHGRYSDRIYISRFTDRSHLTLIAGLNNTNSRGMGGPRGFGGESGQTTRKNVALSYSWENGLKRNTPGYFSFSTDWRFDHRINQLVSETSSETFLSAGGSSSFSNGHSQNRTSNGNFSGNMRIVWQPDSMTQFSFRPRISYSRSKSKSQSMSATFNDDPYEVGQADTPLDSIMRAMADQTYTLSPELAAIAINGSHQRSRSYSHSFTLGGSLNLTRKLSSKGTNLSLELEGSIGNSKSRSYSLSDIQYFNSTNDPSFINRYNYTPSKNWNYNAELGYVQWLGGRWFSELEYEFSHRFSDSERTLYRLDSIPYKFPGEGYDYFLADDFTLGTLAAQEIMDEVVDENNSQYARYHYYNHSIKTGVRFSGNPLNLSLGLTFNPQHTTLDYVRPGLIDTRVTRHVFNIAPRIRVRYRFSRTDNLDISYRGSASQPSMTDLIDVWDDSNPLSISGGNPNLKPSWTNTLNAMYRGYNTDRQQGYSARISFSQTSNSISDRVVYDESTGVRYTRPDNISGNWNTRGNFMFNTPLDYDRYLSITTNTNVAYSNAVGYISTTDRSSSTRALLGIYYTPRLLSGTSSSIDYSQIYDNATNLSQKNTTKTFTLDETLNLAYRRSWYDIGLIGRVQYRHARATLTESSNLDTWDFSYGASANFTFDWGMAISTDIRMNSRRGYSVSTMNTNELIWNAQISQSFLRNRAATISLQFYDILHKQSNVSRTLSATMRRDSRTNAINSYIMLHFIYKLNIFGGTSKDSQMQRGGQRGQQGQDGPPSDRGGEGGGRSGGGPGGGGPGGFGGGGGFGGPGGGF